VRVAGWYPASNNPQHRLDTPARLGAAYAELRRVAEAAGRDPKSIDVGYLVLWPVDWTAQKLDDGTRRLFTGSSADMAADAAALAGVGVRHVALTFQTATVAETLARLHRFAGEVMPLAR
jgi:alkanesulfonate monooxygenase SsuD/methylene tetrahydromethanopterin reductase-like flavin-dependent oxidoreductase (luciferase family)